MRLFELLNSAEVIGVKKMVCVLQLFTTGGGQGILIGCFFSFRDLASEPSLEFVLMIQTVPGTNLISYLAIFCSSPCSIFYCLLCFYLFFLYLFLPGPLPLPEGLPE